MRRRFTSTLLAGLVLGASALAGESEKTVLPPPAPLDEGWRFSLALPGWIPWIHGDAGVNGAITHLDLDPKQLVPHLDFAADLRLEAHKGRFSVLGEYFYSSLSDGKATDTVVKKLDLRIDQTIAELGFGWRLLEGKRGYLDVVAGVRYTNLYQRVTIQPNAQRAGEASTALVDAVGERLRTALSESGLRDVIQQQLDAHLAALDGRNPALPTAPIGGPVRDEVRARIAALIDARKAELGAALQARAAAASDALRARAQARVDEVKSDLSRKIARTLESKLNTAASRTDDWFDPFIGLSGRYNLNEKFYLTAKGNVGGFGVGSDLTWTVEGALGWQLSRYIFVELGYRALGVNYDDDGLLMDTITHGPQVTTGIAF